MHTFYSVPAPKNVDYIVVGEDPNPNTYSFKLQHLIQAMKNRRLICRGKRFTLKCIIFSALTFFVIAQLSVGIFRFSIQGDWGVIDRARSLFTSQIALSGKSKCVQPALDLNDPHILKYLKPFERITCDKAEKDWVVNNGTHAFITAEAEATIGEISCKFIELERSSDFETKESGKVTIGEYFKFETSDYVRVKCTSAADHEKSWSSFFASPRANIEMPEIIELVEHPHPPLNVLIWGHDSLSRNMFIRKLPLTYTYLTARLNAIEMEGYNIVGDGTPQALFPFLTGQTEKELPEARKSQGKAAHTMDDFPFVWRDYHQHGYLTAFIEDSPGIGTFTYRLKGFDKTPTDYYMRTYFLALQPHVFEYPPHCTGSIPRHKVSMDYVKNILTANPSHSKFVFSFLSELSHDDRDPIQGSDDDLQYFISDLEASGMLNKTALIVMSDHGSRFGRFRETLQGKQEERKPMVLFVLPKWFKNVYPEAYQNMELNRYRLSTPFDMHESLLDILRIHNLTSDYFKQVHSLKSRGLSLFREISTDRMCSDAGIEPHWCACLEWNTLNTNDTKVKEIAIKFVQTLNSMTAPHRKMCSSVELNKILWAAKLNPTNGLLQFKQSKDLDGFVPDLSDSTTVSSATVQLKIETIPGLGHYEVSVSLDVKNQDFTIKETDISRIDEYKSQVTCLPEDQTLEHLRKYCFCKTHDETGESQ